MNNSEDPALYLSAREAATELAVSPATLYAYVSRGLIRSEPGESPRSKRYRADDVRALKNRRVPTGETRRFKSFDNELPVLDSAISTITDEGSIYRGVNSAPLSEKATLEQAATLLWDARDSDPFVRTNLPIVSEAMQAVIDATHASSPVARAIAVLALAGDADPRAFSRAI